MATKIKLLHIISSLKRGGAETVLCDLITKLGNQEFEHHVIYFHAGPHIKTLHDLQVSLYYVHGIVFLYDPFFFIRLFLRVKYIKPDIIHSLLWAANFGARIISFLFNIPNVSAYHNNIDQDGTFRNIVDAWTRRLSHQIIAVSQEVAMSLHDESITEKIHVIPNGIDVDYIYTCAKKKNVTKKDIGISQDRMVIGSVGRLVPVKNFPFLIKSFALLEHKNLHLVIVGQGNADNLKALVDKLKIADKVTFIIGESAYGYYPLFDIFVQCSDKEGISIALLEAMSFSIIPVVASLTGSHPVIVHQKNGIIFKASDEHDLIQSLHSIISQQILRKKLGDQGRISVLKSFSSNMMSRRYKQIFLPLSNRKN